jgi:hypothetical protein
MSGRGYPDAKPFKCFGAIFFVIRRTAPDPFDGDRLGLLVGGTLELK